MNLVFSGMLWRIILKNYYCDGICEYCTMGKHYGNQKSGYYTCDKQKVKRLNIIAPKPPDFHLDDKKV